MQEEDCKTARVEAEAPAGIRRRGAGSLDQGGRLEVEEAGRKENCHDPSLWSLPRHELQAQDCLAGLRVPAQCVDSVMLDEKWLVFHRGHLSSEAEEALTCMSGAVSSWIGFHHLPWTHLIWLGAEGETKETGNGFLIRIWGRIPADLMELLRELNERTYTEIFCGLGKFAQ